MLYEFIDRHRDEIVRRCRAEVAARSIPPPTDTEINHGVPLFLDQLVAALRLGLSSSPEIGGRGTPAPVFSAIRQKSTLVRLAPFCMRIPGP